MSRCGYHQIHPPPLTGWKQVTGANIKDITPSIPQVTSGKYYMLYYYFANNNDRPLSIDTLCNLWIENDLISPWNLAKSRVVYQSEGKSGSSSNQHTKFKKLTRLYLWAVYKRDLRQRYQRTIFVCQISN